MANDEKQFEESISVADFAADLYHAFVVNASIKQGVDWRDLPYWCEIAPEDRDFMQARAKDVLDAICKR